MDILLPYLPTFLAIAALTVASNLVPGPNLLMVARAASIDRSFGLSTMAGIVTGAGLWTLLAIVGIGTLLAQSATFYEIFRWLGGGYLLWLAVGLFRRSRQPATDLESAVQIGPRSLWHWYLLGLLTNMTNPKSVVFYASVYTVNLPPNAPLLVQATAILLAMAVPILTYGSAAFGLSTASARAAFLRARKPLERFAALIMTAFGLRLILQTR